MSSPDPAALHRRFGTHFVLITRAWRQAADRRLAPLGLTHATATALLLLRGQRGVPCRQGALAAALGIEQPSLVPLVDQLAAAGLVERQPDLDDRRAKRLHLTRAGQAAAAEADRHLTALRAELLGGADPADLEAAMRVLEAMRAAIGQPAPEPGSSSGPRG